MRKSLRRYKEERVFLNKITKVVTAGILAAGILVGGSVPAQAATAKQSATISIASPGGTAYFNQSCGSGTPQLEIYSSNAYPIWVQARNLMTQATGTKWRADYPKIYGTPWGTAPVRWTFTTAVGSTKINIKYWCS